MGENWNSEMGSIVKSTKAILIMIEEPQFRKVWITNVIQFNLNVCMQQEGVVGMTQQ